MIGRLQQENDRLKSLQQNTLDQVLALQNDVSSLKQKLESKEETERLLKSRLDALQSEYEKCIAEQSECTEGQSFEDTERMLNDEIALLKVNNNKTKTEMIRMQNNMNVLQEQYEALHAKHERLKESAAPRFRKKAVQYSELLEEFNEFIEQTHEDREAVEIQMSTMRNEIKELRAIRKQTRTRSGSL